MTLALAQQHITMWWISIGMGFVVVLVVIVLLSLLVSLVTDIDGNVKSLWAMATRLARNTATTWMLQQTASATAALADETGRHAEELSALAASAGPSARSRPLTDVGPSRTATEARTTGRRY